MARPTSHRDALRALFKKRRIATLEDLKRAMGTSSTMTVFRHLKALGYQTSYSHRGKYYTLADMPQFDAAGLWSCRSVWFSRYGNLMETAKEFVEQSESGFTAGELQAVLHVEVKKALLQLARRKQIDREKTGGRYVYVAREKGQRKRQRLLRQQMQAAWEIGVSPLSKELSQELNAAIILFYSLLDEKQRRLYAGLEAFKLGHGGDRKIAEFLEMDVHTVARGRRELFGGQVEGKGVRKKGGGRKAVEKKRLR